jgi:hypothetical protein
MAPGIFEALLAMVKHGEKGRFQGIEVQPDRPQDRVFPGYLARYL